MVCRRCRAFAVGSCRSLQKYLCALLMAHLSRPRGHNLLEVFSFFSSELPSKLLRTAKKKPDISAGLKCRDHSRHGRSSAEREPDDFQNETDSRQNDGNRGTNHRRVFRKRAFRTSDLNSSSFFTRTGLRIEQVCSTTKNQAFGLDFLIKQSKILLGGIASCM